MAVPAMPRISAGPGPAADRWRHRSGRAGCALSNSAGAASLSNIEHIKSNLDNK